MPEDQDPKARQSRLTRLVNVIKAIFGAFHYEAPPWLARVGAKVSPQLGGQAARIGDRGRRFGEWRRAHPRKFWGSTLGLLLVLAGGAGLYVWYDRQPKPTEYTFWTKNPSATDLFDGAKPEPLRIRFSGSVARLEQVGKPVTKGIRLSPVLAGEWKWEADNVLMFTPDLDWDVGTSYTATFEKSLFPEFVRLKRYVAEFQSAPFVASFGESEFYQDPKQPKVKRAVATLKFSHPVDSATLEKRIKITLNVVEGIVKKKLPVNFTVTYDKLKGHAYIQSEVIAIPKKDAMAVITLEKGVKSSRGGPGTASEQTADVTVPGMYSYFRVGGTRLELVRNEKFEPEQVIMLELTAPVHPDQVKSHFSVYLLPVDRPAIAGAKARKKYHWHDAREIGPEVLKESALLPLIPIPTELEYSREHHFKYQAPPGRHVYLRFTKGAVAYGDYVLADTYDSVQRVPEFPRELKIMHDGALLSLSGGKKLSLLARNIGSLQIELGRVLPNQLNHLITQAGGSFAQPQFQNYQFNEDNLTERTTEVRTLGVVEPGKTQYTAVDFDPHVGGPEAKRGLFFVKVSGWDPINKVVTEPEDRRFILVTDLGVLVKREKDGGQVVFVQSIQTGRPIPEAMVEVLGKNGLAVVSARTGLDGSVRFPKLKDFDRERAPVAFAVKKGNDLSFLPFNRHDRELALSRFDVGGVSSDVTGEKLTAYLFSDRGIYRPGDEFHIGLIVRKQSWKESPSGIPVEAVVTDPRGVEIHKKKLSLSSTGFEELSYRPAETSPTGQYGVNLYIVKDHGRGALLGSTTVRVEEFLPDRMRIATRLSTERTEGWVKPESLKGHITLKTLFGIPAENRRIRAEMGLNPTAVAFRPFKDHRFFDPRSTTHSFTEQLGDAQTDAKGEAEFDLNLARFEKATYRLVFYAEGFEPDGGRAVSAESAVIVSPLDYMVGFKPDGELGYVSQATDRSVELIAVSPEMKPIPVDKITLHLIESKYVSALVKQDNGNYKYQSVRKETTLSKTPFSIPEKGSKLKLPTDKAGDFAYVLKDESDTQLARVEFNVAGKENLTRELEKNAELQVKLSKADYAVGEDIELQIVAPYVGSGLITIERENVLAHKWFHATTTSTVERIKVPAGIEGNAYVTVAYVRAIDSKEIFMSPLSFAAAPFSISRTSRMNPITLEVADRARPGEPFKLRFKTAKPGRIAVIAVDEGILQVARYKTPDPLAHFFQKRALEVTTSQILDLILPEFALVKELAAPGGGEGEEALGKNLNPFKRKRDKPVAYWSGLKNATGKWQELVYDVPDHFNGTLRVMAIAVSEDAIGVEAKKSFIRGNFVLTPSVPTFAAPGDEFTVGVAVANLIEGQGESSVDITASVSQHLTLLPPLKHTVKIGENREATVRFRVKANDVLGSGSIFITAATGDKKGKVTTDLSVRPPVPYVTRLRGGQLKKDSAEHDITRTMYPDYRHQNVAVSHLPLGLARGLMTYLEGFPYLCTEQLVSKAFPLLVLRQYPEMGWDAAKVTKAFDDTIAVLRARQNDEGAFGFWAANSHVSNFQNAYAVHFLTEAKEKGYPVPKDLLDKSLEYLKTLAGKEPDSLGEERIAAYAVYLLTRNGIVTSSYLAGMRRRLDTLHKDTWRGDLTAAFLAGAYHLLQQKDQSYALLKTFRFTDSVTAAYGEFYDGIVRSSLYIYLLGRHFPERIADITPDMLLTSLNPLWAGSYNTINSSYAILALSAYADAHPTKQTVKVALDEADATGKYRSLIVPNGLFPKVSFTEKAKKIRLATKSEFPIFYALTEAGFDRGMPTFAIKDNLEILREFVDSGGKAVTEAKLGDQLEVHLKIRTIQAGSSYGNVAIVDLLPGGFEVVLDTVRGQEAAEASDGSGDPTLHEGSPEEGGEGEEYREPDAESEGDPEARHALPKRVMLAGPLSFPAASSKSTFSADYVDVREDRVVVFGNVSSDVREFVYRIRATNEGDFHAPPTFGEGMYDRSVQALSTGTKFTVKGNP